ncbi:hypothetical protein An06g00140 [Aspergillus niger]|uniref:Uncharacterized protein n=2 Tax=Aspergillus niger TaxID=5061 RepID=A2QL69_ASPNC|nr:hypothetical protein An06g00140 [Aspergillus niger]CAK44930.1 hypothetical protein An06g00140 [Aspergillus niger]
MAGNLQIGLENIGGRERTHVGLLQMLVWAGMMNSAYIHASGINAI